MNKKIIIMISVILSMFLLSGCSGGNTQQVTVDNPYLGGSQGLIATFEPMGIADNGGTESIYENEEFPVDITLKNQGEFNVPANSVKTNLKGITTADYTGLTMDTTTNPAIEKISTYNQKGGETTITHNKGKIIPARMAGRNIMTANIFANVIYPYETYVSAPKVCFKSTSGKDTGVCEVENAALQVFSSGAPIRAVSAKETRAGTNVVSVEFTIENAGGGESKSKTKTEFDYRYNDIDFEVGSSTPSGIWTCTNAGKAGIARFGEDNKLTIICKSIPSAIQTGSVYQSQLDLVLKYDYKVVISRNLIIKGNQ